MAKALYIVVIMAIVVLMTCCDDNTKRYADILAQGGSKDYAVNPRQAGKGLHILFLGDTGFGESYQPSSFFESREYGYFLEKVNPLLSGADLVIANLETPLTDLAESPFSGEKDYIHRGNPHETPAVMKNHNIRFVSLANNHTLDCGVEGLSQTLQVLAENDIECFGAGMNSSQAFKPLHYNLMIDDHSLRLIVASGFEYRRRYDSKYHFYAGDNRGGVNRWKIKNATEQIRAIRQEDRDAFIVAFPHWGRNYRFKTRGQTKLAHALIDAGSDLVVGHGAHTLQEIERYRGKWIIYSLGNFVFNSPGRYTSENAAPFSLAACLSALDRDGKLALTLRLYPILSDNQQTGYQPRPVTQEEMDSVRGIILQHSPDFANFQRQMSVGEDEIGFFLALDIALTKSGNK